MHSFNLEEAIVFGKDLLEEHGDIIPTFLLERGDEVAVVARNFESTKEKMVVREALKRMIEDEGIERYYSVFVVWMVEREPDEEVEKMPSEQPDRQEMLVVSKHEKDVGTDTVAFPIDRLGDDAVSLGERTRMDGVSSFNRWNVWQPMQIDLERAVDNGGE